MNTKEKENNIQMAIRLCGGDRRVAELTGVSRTTVWRWKTAGHIRDFEAALKIAKELKCPVDHLASPGDRIRKRELKLDLLLIPGS